MSKKQYGVCPECNCKEYVWTGSDDEVKCKKCNNIFSYYGIFGDEFEEKECVKVGGKK